MAKENKARTCMALHTGTQKFTTAEFNLVERAAHEEAAVAGRKVPITADYISAVTGLLAAQRTKIDAFMEKVTKDAAKVEEPQVDQKPAEDTGTGEAVPEPVGEKDEQGLLDAVENAKAEEEYASAMDALVTYYNDAEVDTPLIQTYLEENHPDKAFQRAWYEAERRYNAALEKEAKGNGIEMGRSKKGTESKVDKATADAITKALTGARLRQGTGGLWVMSLEAVQKQVDKILANLKNAPQITVESDASPYLDAGSGIAPKGVTLADGRIIIFANAASSPLDIAFTVFHELFHRGLKSYFSSNKEYVAKMRELAASDPDIRREAEEWKKSSDGRAVRWDFIRNGPMNAERQAQYDAIAVEEALANIAELLPSKPSLVRRIAEFLGKLAESMGLHRVAIAIRNMPLSEAEQFVREVLTKAGDPVKAESGYKVFRTEKELEAAEKDAPKAFVAKYKRTAMGRLVRDFMAGWRGQPWVLGFLTLDQIKDRFPGMASVTAAVDKWLFMGSRANELMNIPAKLSEQWGMLTRRQPKETQTLNELFVRTTLESIWVDGEMEPAKDPRNKHLDFKDPAVVKAAGELRRMYASLPKEHQQLYKDVTKALGDQFRAKQDAVLKHVVDMFADDLKGAFSKDELMEYARMDKIGQLQTKADVAGGLSVQQRLDLQKLTAALDSAYVPAALQTGPYFPLQRKGSYIVSFKSTDYKALEKTLDEAREQLNKLLAEDPVTDEKGAEAQLDNIKQARQNVFKAKRALEEAKASKDDYSVKFFDSISEATDFADDLRQQKGDAGQVSSPIRRQEFQPIADSVPSSFLNKLNASLEKQLPAETVKDVSAAVRQIIISSLPERAALKAELRRMNVDGVKPEDALDSFKEVSNRNAWTISRMENISDLTKALSAAHGSEDMDERAVGNELMKRYAKSLQYTPRNALIDAASNLSYISHLGFSVGYYFQNMLQPWTVSMPVLAGRHGLTTTANELSKATSEVVKAMTKTMRGKEAFNMDLKLDMSGFSEDEQRLIKQLTDEGRIDITVRADLGVGGSAQGGLSHIAQRAAEISSWPAHQVETVNRVATALAAFRMEMRKDKNFNKAMVYADKIVAQTHVDYSSENTARFMNPNAMGGLGRLAFQFRRYQQAIVFLWGKTLVDAIRQGGWNENTKSLVYLTGVNFAMAGAAGLPIAAPLGLLAKAISMVLSDPGDDDDYAEMFKAGIRAAVGDKATAMLTKGIPAMGGIDLSSSLGSGDILSPIYRLPHAQTGQEWAGAMALQLFGAAGGTISNWADAIMVAKDNPAMALQKIAPKGISGLLAAESRRESGLTDRKGSAVIEKDELGVVDYIAKGLSLGESAKVTRMYDTRSAIKNEESARQEYRARLLRESYAARKDGDTEKAVKVREKIAEFNSRAPGARILPKDIQAYYQQQTQRQRESHTGIRVTKRNADIAEEYGVTP